MMAQECFREEEEADQFFDSTEELPSLPDSFEQENSTNLFSWEPLYQVWINSPGSIHKRRAVFKKVIGLNYVDVDGELIENESSTSYCNRLSLNCGTVLSGSDSENGSNVSSRSDEVPSTSEDRSSCVQLEYRIKNLDDGAVFVADEFIHDDAEISLREVGLNLMVTVDESERSHRPSSSIPLDISLSSNYGKTPTRRTMEWLRRLGVMACIADQEGHGIESSISDHDQTRVTGLQRVRVRPYRKRIKDLSAIFMGQNFVAHQGAILTMKFSHDGEYLASGGEDGIVRVWKVMECERSDAIDIIVDDPSSIYFSMNDDSKLSPFYIDKKKNIVSKGLLRTSHSACVVIPREIFRISEKPFYEFRGHNGDVLDLAWSKNLDLLSSSVDKTVRLWKLGCDRCIEIFPHNNYVTSIQFNPIDERYFISGSIDGKARIWEVSTCRVVDWIDVRQIITAVCYRPDGKVVVVGSMMGDCRFYDTSENQLQFYAEVSFNGRKKSIDKRITGFQFCPSSHHKLMVTCADSKVRILDGIDLVSKFKGLRNAQSRISAAFTSNGQHIISASEDSSVYIWNYSNQNPISSNKHVKSSWSSERFTSSHASVAIPWPGFFSRDKVEFLAPHYHTEPSEKNFPFFVNSRTSSSTRFSSSFTLWPELFSEITSKGSATWPEEKLPSNMPKRFCPTKRQLKFPKASWQKNICHSWGQVIVTAGWDGKIKSFQNYGLPVSL